MVKTTGCETSEVDDEAMFVGWCVTQEEMYMNVDNRLNKSAAASTGGRLKCRAMYLDSGRGTDLLAIRNFVTLHQVSQTDGWAMASVTGA